MNSQNCQKFITNMGRDFIAIVTIFLEWLYFKYTHEKYICFYIP